MNKNELIAAMGSVRDHINNLISNFTKEPQAPPLDSDEPLSVEWCDEWLKPTFEGTSFILQSRTMTTPIFLLKEHGASFSVMVEQQEIRKVKTPNELRRLMAAMGIEHRVTEGCLMTIDPAEITDGYHTMAELYEHRHHLFIALMLSNPEISWRALLHHDGTMYDDFFIAGMQLPQGQISYHMPLCVWEMLDCEKIETLHHAPKWDGHNSFDVINRLWGWCEDMACQQSQPDTVEVDRDVLEWAETELAAYLSEQGSYWGSEYVRKFEAKLKQLREALEGEG